MKNISTQMGAHEHYERNLKKAKRDGLNHCAHCGKGINENAGYLVRWMWQNDSIIPFDSESGEIKHIGNTCIKNIAFEEIPLNYFVKAGN